jgi:hypothetical protein
MPGPVLWYLSPQPREINMSYVNVGAFINGKRCPSKKALREAMIKEPRAVTFDSTAAFEAHPDFLVEGVMRGDLVKSGMRLAVVGPDPYNNRKWYATVERTAKGVKVS